MTSANIILNDGNQIPWLAFGTGTALFSRDAESLTEQAIRTGIIHLDGAQVYKNEDSLGRGIKASGKSRNELFITTKLIEDAPIENIKSSLKESLQKLDVEYIDLFLIHSPHGHNKRGTLPAVWKELETIKKEGLSKSIGVSNFTVEDLKIVLDNAEIIPAVNQIELHPYVWKAAEPIVKFSQEHGIVISSFGGQSPIARAAGGPVDSVLETIRQRVEGASQYPVTLGQVLVKWLRAKNAVVVTTSSKESRIKEFIKTTEVPDLSPDEVKEIDSVGSTLHKRYFMRHVYGE